MGGGFNITPANFTPEQYFFSITAQQVSGNEIQSDTSGTNIIFQEIT